MGGDPLFSGHPKLAPELQRLGIPELGLADRCQEVGPVELEEERCTAPLMYSLFGEGGCSKYKEDYYVEVHILAGVGNQPGGGGDIWIEDLWFRIESVDEDDTIPLLVP
jgi:hypothetical protein